MPVWEAMVPVLTTVANIISEGLGAAFTTLMGVINAVVAYVASFILILADLIAGNITFGEALGQVWESLKTMIFSILGAVMSGIGSFVIQLVQKGVEAASGFVNNIIIWISQLPGQMWMWLLQTYMQIGMWRISITNQAVQAGMNFVNSVITFISTLPGQMWGVFLSGIMMVLNFGTHLRIHAGNIARMVPDVILGGFRQIYSIGVGIFNQISGAFGRMRDGLVSAAAAIRDRVWGPINELWNSLKRFWGWITSPFGGGGGAAGSRGTSHAGGAGHVGGGYAGAAPSGTASLYSGSGFFGGVMNAAFNTTENLSGHRPRARQYAGQDSIDDDLYPEECDSCRVAGPFDFSKKWIDEILRVAKGWGINIHGVRYSIEDFTQKGSMSMFAQIARKLISGTRHDWYYNARYSDAEALRRRSFNCFDGAEILINLARRMGLSAHMGFGQWGRTGHVWAVVNGIPFDTTAWQKGHGWTAPAVRYHGPSPSPHTGGPAATPHQAPDSRESVNLSGEITFKHEYSFENLPESVSREDMEAMIKKAPEQKEFMNLINEQFMRILQEKRRFAGV
ncbi:MAG: hypothetical protein DDT33_01514 [Firmicutes bacterium]|nr:hypothetical protein [Bacillota bacterium]